MMMLDSTIMRPLFNAAQINLSAAADPSRGGNYPAANAGANLSIHPGDRLPGIPAHQVKFGVLDH